MATRWILAIALFSTSLARADSKPFIVAPTALEELRVSGRARIAPDTATRNQIVKDQQKKVVALHKYCVDETGKVTSAALMHTSGYPAWDDAITKAMLTTWRFRPFLVTGKPVAVCTARTQIFDNPSAPPPPPSPRPSKPTNWHRRVD